MFTLFSCLFIRKKSLNYLSETFVMKLEKKPMCIRLKSLCMVMNLRTMILRKTMKLLLILKKTVSKNSAFFHTCASRQASGGIKFWKICRGHISRENLGGVTEGGKFFEIFRG